MDANFAEARLAVVAEAAVVGAEVAETKSCSDASGGWDRRKS